MSPINHRCHAAQCPSPCPPSRLMCVKHWRMVPKNLQRAVWSNYRPGQEVDKQPTQAYLAAAQAAIDAVAQREGITA